MTMTYAFPDLHGRRDHFREATSLVAAHAGDRPHTLVFLGDYIDRGPESAQLVADLRELKGRDDLRVVILSGNHEMMMLWALGDETGQAAIQWKQNGGNTTIESYRNAAGDIDEARVVSDARWFVDLPMIYSDRHRVYVHAQVDPNRSLDDQPGDVLHWGRYSKDDGRGHGELHVVHGHTPDKNGPVTTGQRTCLDVGACWTGRYVVGVFDDDLPGGPVEVLEVNV